jgi:hypothetical protein
MDADYLRLIHLLNEKDKMTGRLWECVKVLKHLETTGGDGNLRYDIIFQLINQKKSISLIKAFYEVLKLKEIKTKEKQKRKNSRKSCSY